ncbi:MAG: metallophosphoesterase [Proteobacteria bacterium]|nr:metallophosphoesterase [Pseudomonadota bacterium]
MKVLFTTDLHGAKRKYEGLLDVAQQAQADVVINGGDMLPSVGNLLSQGDYITNYLDAHLREFDEAGIYYLCYLGNDDLRIFDEIFEKTCNKYPLVHNLAQCKIEIGDIEFIGMNWVVDYPFRLKDRCRMDTIDYIFQEQYGTALVSTTDGLKEIKDWFSYARTLPTIEEELNTLVTPNNIKQTVYVIHMPPYKLGLDKCGHGAEVGSKAIYDFLRSRQPRLSLHGHIHESPEYSGKWHAKIGNTVCIQPGQLTSFTYVTIDLKTMQFDRHVTGV